MTSVIAVPEPLYGTPNRGAPLRSFKNSKTTRADVLGSATLILSGCALAAATSSGIVLGAKPGLAATTIGSIPISTIGAKSFSAL